MIFTNRPSGKEIINDGQDGFLVNPEDVNQIANRVLLLFNDESLRN